MQTIKPQSQIVNEYILYKSKSIWLWSKGQRPRNTHYELVIDDKPDDVGFMLYLLSSQMGYRAKCQANEYQRFIDSIIVFKDDTAKFGENEESFIENITVAFKDYQLLK